MPNYYDGLLKLCEFEDEEILTETPRIDKAFRRLELGPEDFEKAEKWVKQVHEVELRGVRRILGVWIKELVDLVLAKDEGKKVVYYGFPALPGPGMAMRSASEDIYCACPDAIICHTLGQIFDKLKPVLEAGEENGLPPGHGLCSLWQVRAGALAKGYIPVPDFVICSSFYCDMGSKADELLQQIYGHPAVYVDGSMDSRWGEYPDYHPQRIDLLARQLNKLFDTATDVLGVVVNEEVWRRGQSTSRAFFHKTQQLYSLMTSDPMPLGPAAVEIATMLGAVSTGRAITEGPEALSILCQEVEERVAEGFGVVERGVPRVLTLVDSFCDPRIANMIQDAGLAAYATLFSVPTPERRGPPRTYSTIGERLAEWAMRDGLYHSSFGGIKRCEEAVRACNVDGVLWNYQYNCRPGAQHSLMVKKWLEANTGVPTLSLEMDIYDSRDFSAATLRSRIDAFADMLRARKAASSSRPSSDGRG